MCVYKYRSLSQTYIYIYIYIYLFIGRLQAARCAEARRHPPGPRRHQERQDDPARRPALGDQVLPVQEDRQGRRHHEVPGPRDSSKGGAVEAGSSGLHYTTGCFTI